MADALGWIEEAERDWSARRLERRLICRDGSEPGRIAIGGRSLVNFGGNDYLGLAADPRITEAARAAAETYGWGAGASPLVTGWTTAHQALADALANFERTEAAALFPTGFAANLGAIVSLVGPGDAVYIDRLNHACLIDGAKLSGARLRVYPHNDSERLAAILERDRGRFRRRLIATDGVFSMDGDLAPLADLADLAERFDAMLLVDEAHGTGVFGADGRGAASECGVADRVDVKVGTLSKALGSIGGFVAGSRRLIDWLINHARTMIYSTSLPPAAAAAAWTALEIAKAEPWRRERVRALGARVAEVLCERGFEKVPPSSPIVPAVVGDADQAVALADRFRREGLMIPAIRPPTVPVGTARLRISLSSAHSDDDIQKLLDQLIHLQR